LDDPAFARRRSGCRACARFPGRTKSAAAKRALAAIWRALEQAQVFPELGAPTADANIRQIVVRFGSSGYIARYTVLPATGDILVTRLWHGREARE
jgi:plasmid stabilization system protein ParE